MTWAFMAKHTKETFLYHALSAAIADLLYRTLDLNDNLVFGMQVSN